MTGAAIPASVDETEALLRGGDYIPSRAVATAVFLALSLERPLLLEGEAGVGKTELARVLASRLQRRLIRLQCFEGLDLASAAWEWNFPRQMLAIRRAEAGGDTLPDDALYTDEFLVERPLLAALRHGDGAPPVLLIDELDRADEPFEAFLLELLSDYQLSIPELGTVRATSAPIVIITSNRTREIHDALRRRCLYHWLDYPDASVEAEILRIRAPGLAEQLAAELLAFVQALREQDLYKPPGIAETVDWAAALSRLDATALTSELVEASLGALLKYQDDMERVRGGVAAELIERARSAA